MGHWAASCPKKAAPESVQRALAYADGADDPEGYQFGQVSEYVAAAYVARDETAATMQRSSQAASATLKEAQKQLEAKEGKYERKYKRAKAKLAECKKSSKKSGSSRPSRKQRAQRH